MELTGTNGPTAYTITPLTGWSRVDYTIPGSHTPPAAATGRVSDRLDGGHSGGETPGPIPNPVAKPASADGTALCGGRVGRCPFAPPHGESLAEAFLFPILTLITLMRRLFYAPYALSLPYYYLVLCVPFSLSSCLFHR